MFTLFCGGELKVSVKNPFSEELIFLLFDSVHLLKSIRNNWLNIHHTNQTFFYPDIQKETKCIATLFHLKEILRAEGKSVKFAPSLSLKVLYPLSLERQNVSYAIKLFDKKVAAALQKFAQNVDYIQTKDFIERIAIWWNVMNVKHPEKGKQLRDIYCRPIYTKNDEQIKFLNCFIEFLDAWDKFNLKQHYGRLSYETHFALKHSTYATIHLIEYLFKKFSLKFVLLGKFQTDNLEARFGQYRQMCGGNYHVSVVQVLECEKKLKFLSLLKLKSERIGNFHIKDLMSAQVENCMQHSFKSQMDICFECFDDVPIECEIITVPLSTVKILVFTAGYAVHKLLQTISCEKCKSVISCLDKKLEFDILHPELISYIKEIDRGGLSYPSDLFLTLTVELYKPFQCLLQAKYDDQFLQCKKQSYL
ncbi:uncharacterized protein LOC111637309 [Centruroides sculpturatus]|uniref:uncharacterized protein LOC111637309 n=1 Tax=Centruroides sculpturatus TaxID=218467 RepID=UPI000C6D0551|nr:uncharacterized protein LOC111637309 [Centruroides sculpturatus]